MVTSPYEWKVLELEEKPQTKKQSIFLLIFSFIFEQWDPFADVTNPPPKKKKKKNMCYSCLLG